MDAEVNRPKWGVGNTSGRHSGRQQYGATVRRRALRVVELTGLNRHPKESWSSSGEDGHE